MPTIDNSIKRIDSVICRHLDEIEDSSRGAISQDILEQLVKFINHIMLKFYANGKEIEINEENLTKAIEYCQVNSDLYTLYKMMSAKDDEIKYLEIKLEQMGLDYQIFKDDIEEHRIAYVDTPEFEENYISKDKIKELIEKYKKEKNNMTQIVFSKYEKTQQSLKQAVYTNVIRLLEKLLGEKI